MDLPQDHEAELRPGRHSVGTASASRAGSSASVLPRRNLLIGGVGLAAAAVAAIRFGGSQSRPDAVQADEAGRRAAALAGLGPVGLAAVATADIPGAVQALRLQPADERRLTDDLDAGRRRLAWLSLYDADMDDGDVVEIRTAGFSHAMTLAKQPVAVAIPVSAGEAVTLVGLVDGGGGGITVGVLTRTGPVPLPPMSVGQVLALPVAVV